MSDLFGGLDVAGAPEIGLQDGDHEGTITNMEKTFSKANDPYFVIHYNVKGINLQEWKALPTNPNPQAWDRTIQDNKGLTEYDRNQRALGFIQARLKDLGVPLERMNTIRPEDLKGMKVLVTTKKNDKGFASVVNAKTIVPSGATAVTATPTASVSTPAATAPAPTPAPTPAPSGENPFE